MKRGPSRSLRPFHQYGLISIRIIKWRRCCRAASCRLFRPKRRRDERWTPEDGAFQRYRSQNRRKLSTTVYRGSPVRDGLSLAWNLSGLYLSIAVFRKNNIPQGYKGAIFHRYVLQCSGEYAAHIANSSYTFTSPGLLRTSWFNKFPYTPCWARRTFR
jgi:hypothetical protein